MINNEHVKFRRTSELLKRSKKLGRFEEYEVFRFGEWQKVRIYERCFTCDFTNCPIKCVYSIRTTDGRIKNRALGTLRAHDVWNFYHPDDPIGPDEVIHHIDCNKTNDTFENLDKLNSTEHRQLHINSYWKSSRGVERRLELSRSYRGRWKRYWDKKKKRGEYAEKVVK